ncbi:hypothetical protein L1987_43965 [Smallanthus sonchifolius]|uniref:Uncharacterized protein n=1 Tax=Smallanthus sonchifolius TaxID=185202 RepID=A0ACB9GNU6_9ASTR|nr:hypothetical protein L1987_43965 [Smallanthus sonchifolius]
MVPEWREAYMNYNYLKTLLKEILIFHRRQTRSPENQVNSQLTLSKAASLKRRASLFRAFSGLTSRYGNSSDIKDKEDEVILVSALQTADEEHGKDDQSYQTVFLRPSEEGGDLELVFFRGLDHEFNKVVHFYKTKVEEVVKQAEELSVQMDALIALRIKVSHPVNPHAAVSPFINETNTGSYPLEAIHEEEQKRRSDDARGYQMASLEVLNHVKLNANPKTPLSMIKSVFKSFSLELHFNKNEVRDAEEKLKQAFIEFHQKLRFLQNYA